MSPLRRVAIIICSIAIPVALAARRSAAQTAAAPLTPTADAFLSANNSTSNYGGAGALAVSGAATANAKGAFDSLVRFNTSAAKSTFDAAFGPGAWVIQSAQLKVTSASPNNAIFNSPSVAGNFALSLVSDDTWVEGSGMPNSPTTTGVTFGNQPSAASDQTVGTFAYSGATSGAATYTLPLPPSFLNALASGGDVNLRFTAVDSTMSWVFNSKDFTTLASRPSLTLTAVPEPAMITLLPAAATLLLRRRRKEQ